MGVITLAGSIAAGPPPGSEDQFPGMSAQIALSFVSQNRSYSVATGVLTRNLAASGSFTALEAVGATDAVTQGQILFVRCNAPCDLEITSDDGSGGNIVEPVVPIKGIYLREFDDPRFLKLLRARSAAGAQLVYFACGQL